MGIDIQKAKNPILITIRDQPLKAKQISVEENHTIILDINNNVWICGETSSAMGTGWSRIVRSKLKRLEIKFKCKYVATGLNHSALIDVEDNLWTFGSSLNDKLGYEIETNVRLIEIPRKVPNIKAIKVECNNDYTVAISPRFIVPVQSVPVSQFRFSQFRFSQFQFSQSRFSQFRFSQFQYNPQSQFNQYNPQYQYNSQSQLNLQVREQELFLILTKLHSYYNQAILSILTLDQNIKV